MISEIKSATGSLQSGQKLFGTKVENPRGERLGKIEDIMISVESGQIAYAVVSYGGVLSLGNKFFAFPWSALHADSSGKKMILNLDKKTLSSARGFDKDHWPDSSGWDWSSSVPSPSSSPPAPLERAAISDRAEAPRFVEPPVVESPALEPMMPAKDQMEQWGKSWQSHGLDRS
jgi:sporulation protein YlmC with PRC-barrel domain